MNKGGGKKTLNSCPVVLRLKSLYKINYYDVTAERRHGWVPWLPVKCIAV